MRISICLLVLLFSTGLFAQLSDQEIIDLKRGRQKNDTSYVYSLPYLPGKAYVFVQGAKSKFSHKNELSYDFKMKPGSTICAARAGIVTGMRNDSDKGGLKPAYLSEGNYIIIQHDDGSNAYYWHLQKAGTYRNIGDTVSQGDIIGLSGNTGYSAFPHLHFHVSDSSGKEILVRFKTPKGIKYLIPGKIYRRPV